MARPEIFRTPRLVATGWDPEADAAEAHAVYADPEVTHFIGGRPSTSVDDQRERLVQLVERDAGLGVPFGGFAIRTRAEGRLVGVGLLQPLRDADRRWIEGEIEIGWHLGRAFWGHGYATEMGRGLVERGFAHLDVDVLHAVVDAENQRSRAVAERLGMEHVGSTDRYYGQTLELYVLRRPERG